jgi:hypothetical protein
MLRAIRNIWHGDREWIYVSDAKSLWRKMPYALLLAGLIIFGCFPRLLTDNIKKSLPDLLPSQTMVAQIQK